jgi:transposase
MTGFSVGTVHNIHSKYIAKGDKIFVTGISGGRKAAYMSEEEESAFLEPFTQAGDVGGILEISPIHKAHCEILGKDIPLSTTYRLLHRHGWRKIEPRPRHPKANKDAQADFKKMA